MALRRGEFVQPAQQAALGPAADAHAPEREGQQYAAVFLALGHGRGPQRIALGFALDACPADGGEGAVLAAGVLRRADGRAEVHQRLVVVAGALLADAGQGLRLQIEGGLQGALHGEAAGQHAHLVAVQSGGADIVGDGCDGPGGVGADSGQALQPLDAVREVSAGCGDGLCCGVQVPRAGVVAQALPELEHLVLIGGRQRKHVREALQKALVVAAHSLGAGLLEHDLREPDAVGVARAPPGQLAGVAVVPGKQQVAELHLDKLLLII